MKEVTKTSIKVLSGIILLEMKIENVDFETASNTIIEWFNSDDAKKEITLFEMGNLKHTYLLTIVARKAYDKENI